MAKNMQIDRSKSFVNPYNFVSMSLVDPREHTTDENRNLTGYIDCSLLVKGLLALPDKQQDGAAPPNCYDFYKIGETPLIPGSAIRGCIRSVYEAVTNSCYLTTENEILSARLPAPNMRVKSGFLEKIDGVWKLFAASYRDPVTRKKYSSGTKREWRTASDPELVAQFFRSPVLLSDRISTELIDKLHAAYSIYLENIEKELRSLEKKIESLDDDSPDYSVAMKEKKHYEELRSAVQYQNNALTTGSDKVFVFYERKGNAFTYFSPAAVGRYVFDHTVFDLLGNHHPCTKEKYCPACSLFGTIGDGVNGSQISSHVRFGDAKSKDADFFDEFVELPELSSPKISNMEFYILMARKAGNENAGYSRWTYDSTGAKLRGRKFYFHSQPQYIVANDQGMVGQRSMATKPCKKGTFTFRVCFENISETELGQLCWAIALGENDKKGKQMHKIGAGRPVGFGSVKMTVDRICIRTIDVNGRRYIEDDKCLTAEQLMERAYQTLDNNARRDVKIITDYHLLDGFDVSYPIADTETPDDDHDAGYQWFVANRQPTTKKEREDTRDMDMFKYLQYLPVLSTDASKLTMYAMRPSQFHSGAETRTSNRQSSTNAGTAEFTDKTLLCKDCGERFVFTAREQEYYAGKGFGDPKRCKACRDKRKNRYSS